MAELLTVARPYAEAVFRAALEANNTAGYGQILKALGMVMENAQVSNLMGNPNVSAMQKSDIIIAGTGQAIPDVLSKLVEILIANGRSVLLPYIAEHFAQLQRCHNGLVKAVITSAFPLSESDKLALVQALERKYSKRVEADVTVDESLIGGARIQVGDEVIHASVRDTLDQMATALAH